MVVSWVVSLFYKGVLAGRPDGCVTYCGFPQSGREANQAGTMKCGLTGRTAPAHEEPGRFCLTKAGQAVGMGDASYGSAALERRQRREALRRRSSAALLQDLPA